MRHSGSSRFALTMPSVCIVDNCVKIAVAVGATRILPQCTTRLDDDFSKGLRGGRTVFVGAANGFSLFRPVRALRNSLCRMS